jgi:hypothetical protein
MTEEFIPRSDLEARYLREMKMENLIAEQEYLNVLRNRHLQWMNNADDPEIGRMHGDIVAVIKEMEDRFGILMEALQRQSDKE